MEMLLTPAVIDLFVFAGIASLGFKYQLGPIFCAVVSIGAMYVFKALKYLMLTSINLNPSQFITPQLIVTMIAQFAAALVIFYWLNQEDDSITLSWGLTLALGTLAVCLLIPQIIESIM